MSHDLNSQSSPVLSMAASWDQAWNDAQSQLAAIRASPQTSPSLPRRTIRVGQLDSDLLDLELVQLLKEPLNKTLALLSASLRGRFDPELTLIIQLTLYKLSVWTTGSSYGAKLQDLRYFVSRKRDETLARESQSVMVLFLTVLLASGIPRRVLLLHGTLTILVPYFHSRLRSYALSNAWPDAPSSDARRKAWMILTHVESSLTLLSLLSFVGFLWDGRFRSVVDRILNMSLIPSRRMVKRDVSYEFMNRQMVWQAFTEFLIFALPLINARKIRRQVNRLTSAISQSSVTTKAQMLLGVSKTAALDRPAESRGKYWALPLDQCAICAENASLSLDLGNTSNAFTNFALPETSDSTQESEGPSNYPIYTPYITSCGHLYCYHCVSERMMRAADEVEADADWECLRCVQMVKAAERYQAEFQLGSEMSGSDYDFSSDVDATDLSVDTYSDSVSDLE
ncbi:Pex12 amino terminal region-domain-containing protein [Mycena floridula]|nr:Pex12 amino terminal region-domain-containing protein [Mycena floridula]